MIKDRHTYRIGDILYEVDTFNHEIVKHTITDIYLYSMDRGNVLVQILSDHGGAYSGLPSTICSTLEKKLKESVSDLLY